MTIKMIAMAPIDGRAFIIKDEKPYVLNPPYTPGDLVEVSEVEMAAEVDRHDFRGYSASFPNLSEAVNFLKEAQTEELEKRGFHYPQ
ncbi:MAG: hypothetical protein GY765_02455 [bacterium]|nr:hypothetical protein [bacterium]